MKQCLQECTRLRVKSLSVPSIGAGNLNYPPDIVAKCLLDETSTYMKANSKSTTLKLIHFVVFDDEVHQAFVNKYDDLQTKLNIPDKIKTNPPSHPYNESVMRSSHVSGEDISCTFQLQNDAMLHLVHGDITNERSDVIVNTTNLQLDLSYGGVAKALLSKGGPRLQAACDSLCKQGINASEEMVVQTECEGMGQLQCKMIFHIVFNGKDDWKLTKIVLACLQKAERNEYASISFPAIGTGAHSYPPDLSAKAIVNSLKQFVQKSPNPNLKIIRMVIFQSEIFDQFTAAFKKIDEGEDSVFKQLKQLTGFVYNFGSYFNPGSLFSSMPGLSDYRVNDEMEVLRTKEEIANECEENNPINELEMLGNVSLESEIVIGIYGESEESVKMAEKRLRANIDTQFVNDKIENPIIQDIPESICMKLELCARSHNVKLNIDRDPVLHCIEFRGCQKDVFEVKDKVRDVLGNFQKEFMLAEAAGTFANHVKWVRQISDEQEEYDIVSNFQIEQAFNQKLPYFKSSNEEEQFEIDFSKMEETDLVTKETFQVIRKDLSTGMFYQCVNIIITISNNLRMPF